MRFCIEANTYDEQIDISVKRHIYRCTVLFSIACKTIFDDILDFSNIYFAFRVILDLRRCARNLSLPYKK